jgi:hypothetical protein
MLGPAQTSSTFGLDLLGTVESAVFVEPDPGERRTTRKGLTTVRMKMRGRRGNNSLHAPPLSHVPSTE